MGKIRPLQRCMRRRTAAMRNLTTGGRSPPPPAAKETVGGEGDKRHEHDRSEHGAEKQYEQDPQQSERSAPSSETEASPAETPHPKRQGLTWHGAHEQRHGVQSHLEVPRRDGVDMGHKPWFLLRRPLPLSSGVIPEHGVLYTMHILGLF